ncbi:Pvc16 family protein [Thiococcus pfennigii]|uniref:Pvc16 family protein n=1 Tax=Thiococcus pfennigii TaxID=1057 RepID=UPI0019053562|nr:Pvc16 family protein [Thiococcus pfennigii]MBK1699390.1 hypothetical protein [Thiococcus pfennigii]
MSLYFEDTLRHLFMTHLANELSGSDPQVHESQIRFQPPNDDWRAHVQNVNKPALNICLVDLRENRALRSNERGREIKDGYVTEEPAPARLDCHYLITAWSPASEELGKTQDEHALLYAVSSVLLNTQVLIPREIYAPAPLPPGFPPIELPMTVLPSEGFPKYAEFWGTMGQQPWKPAVYLVLTVPVLQTRRELGAMVTTRIIEYGRGGPGPTETWVQIGGVLRDGVGQGIAGAWVALETSAGEPLQTATTDADGRFTFGGLAPGNHRLRARATGLGETTRDAVLPSPDGNYDLTFS